jgi:hypothetical protein
MLRWTSSSDKQMVSDAYRLGDLVIKADVTDITAAYLINNIELAFKVWHETSWGKDIPFDVFCEEILPYRVSTEPLENWREKALASFADIYRSFMKDTAITTVEACSKVNSLLPRFRIDKDFPPTCFSQLMASARGSCDEMSDLATFSMRALGIPVSTDFTPLWPDRLNGHTWSSVYDNTSGKHVTFVSTEQNPGSHRILIPVSKVLRRTFSIREKINDEQFNIPPVLQDVRANDVTEEYGASANLSIPVVNRPLFGTQYAYLATPYETSWNIIRRGNAGQDSIRFLSVGKRVLYLPVYYKNNMQTAASYPFLLEDNGECRFFQPGAMQSITVTRVAPPHEPWVQRMAGGVFEAANLADFSDAQTLCVIKKIDGSWFHTTSIKNTKKFRYIRYVSPKRANCNVAEIEFYNETGEKLTGSVIGTESLENSTMTRDKAFDGDPATYFDAANDQSWTGLYLDAPQTITKIRYLPRNDGNGIYEGHVYELLYWDGNIWFSLGKKTADGHVLKYDAPANSLLIVKNITAGRIFRRTCIIEDGVQRWLPYDFL